MTAQDRTYLFRWVVLIVGIAGWAVVATVLDASFAGSSSSAGVDAQVPEWPHPPIIVPANTLLDGTVLDFSATLPLPANTSSSPQRPDADSLRAGHAIVRSLGKVPKESGAERARVSNEETKGTSGGTPLETPSAGAQAASAPQAAGSPSTHTARRAASPSANQQSFQPNASTPTPVASTGLGGLVVDETMTPQGRSFYSTFYNVWRSPPVEGFYTVRVQEGPTPGRGTLVQVFVNDDITFQARLHPQTQIDAQARQAARRTYAYVRSGRGILRIY